MSTSRARRSASKIFPWLVAGLAALVISSCLTLIAWTWLQEDEMKELRSALHAQQQKREVAEAQLAAMQSTSVALDERLSFLESSAGQQEPTPTGPSADSNDPVRDIEELKSTMEEIQLELGVLQSTVDSLTDEIEESQAPASGQPTYAEPDTVRLTVARQQQSHNLSCESSAASMAAQYHGVQLSEEEVLASLPLHSNPHLGFRGNVDGPIGGTTDYGVYADPILDVLNARGLQARVLAGGMDGIRAALVRGNPVMAWITYNCQPSTPTTVAIDGQEVTLVPNQHTVVVTGYNSEGLWANDPYDGQEDYYSIGDFARAMSYFGDMAIEIGKP